MNIDAARLSRPFGFPLPAEAWRRDGVRDLSARWPAGGRGIRDYRLLAEYLRGLQAPEQAPAAGDLLCGALLGDALGEVWAHYVRDQEPGVLERVLGRAGQRLGSAAVGQALERFLAHFAAPGTELPAVGPARGLLAGELILRFLAQENPALRPVLSACGDAEGLDPELSAVASQLLALLEDEPPLALTDLSLPASLRAPARCCPEALEVQLAWVREHWGALLPASLLGRFGLAMDLSRGERFQRGGPPGPPPVLTFDTPVEEAPAPAAYSHDANWMPNVVLLAKSAYVWLYQLTRRYGRPVTTLDRIPDEELDKLARWGITGLWLIGLWQRSEASRRIKRIMGNPEAAASAYALFDYTIVPELGGEAAFQELKERAWRRGIRLAGDMVPNHVGLDSRWVVEHPERFVQADEPPYPCYRFDGPDLSGDPRVGLYLEDGYWTRSDAAVVFRHLDRQTGRIRYIYHGNDGTSMPWNDTAQLDYLRADVREAVIGTILEVAHRFPIIRFDAAMTLAKRHYRRLWYPKPGDEGSVPSRVERGLSGAEFDAAFPVEFWREVVDRVAAEAPDTLLLAEAFWLMEGYFVRTLGMHRVYNSAFMNMLKMEENAKYRESIRNVLAYDPGILQRFVNFMNNPDERSAVEQFGRGDKYFGVLMMMVTMPGLPMLGHGQIEGFAEKYGMEYTRAYLDEPVDEGMVARHERQIVPLVRRRRLFSGVARFALYDLVGDDGAVIEDVFVWSNRHGDERALLLYHNAFREAAGRVRAAAPVNEGSVEEPHLVDRDLSAALGLSRAADRVALLRDSLSGQWRIVPCDRLAAEGLRVRLGAYQAMAWAEIREVEDRDGAWRRLAEALGDDTVPDPEAARLDLLAAPLHTALAALLGAWARWWPLAGEEAGAAPPPEAALAAIPPFASALEALGAPPPDPALADRLEAAVRALAGPLAWALPTEDRARFQGLALALPLLAALGAPPPHLRFEAGLAHALQRLGGAAGEADRDARLALLLAEHGRGPAPSRWPGAEGFSPALAAWLGVNVWEGVAWLDRERLESLLSLWSLGAILAGTDPAAARAEAAAISARAEAGGYRVEALRGPSRSGLEAVPGTR
jgi:glycosidase